MSDLASIAIEHILQQFSSHASTHSSPLFVGLQGPQGIGKTTLARALVAGLTCAPHSLRVVALSIDDLYLAHDALQSIGRENSGNGLLQGRGLPGTHDVQLGAEVLKTLSLMENTRSAPVDVKTTRIPAYDKSSHQGLGDRVHEGEWPVVQSPVDIIILEGWCFGCQPLPPGELTERWERRTELGMPGSVRLEHGIDDIKVISNSLKEYANAWYKYFTCFIQVSPNSDDKLSVVYKWRLQQEHAMKEANGGKGMTDEEVIRFVDRYIPGYIFFDEPSARQRDASTPWDGHGLKILVDEERNPVGIEGF
ncbi:hypothetical protein M408DRAFT_326915 [Serendipita vermifera MAFF 305830]|uniref:SRP54-type proteins GTP-binding domain-containing protein n=1 Tax=Serendipita vermifera MAFF 305830 TaxID=933852 RepID=A0A0C3BLH0_SERVB|nr:hypothetical protein M408DRAFT_326915 [Serendipita vermifera MAFF 305830]